jgi:hypothetical protein
LEQYAFYKDQYDKTLDRKNEINSSLSTPIGILTALMAGLFYATTNFNFDDNLILSIVFAVIGLISMGLLSTSIYRLVRAFSDLQNGLEYFYLNDADFLNTYYQGLITFYTAQAGATPASIIISAQKEFEEYLTNELIINTATNQINNREKTFHRFQCHQYMIYSLISLSLLIIPFGIDFGISKGKDKVQKVKVESVIPVTLTLKYKDTTQRLNINPSNNGNTRRNKTDTTTVIKSKGRR